MNFSTDRDLIVLEPAVFDEAPFAAQQRVYVNDAVVSGTTLTSTSADFVEAQVEPGCVVLIAGIAHEVLMRVDAQTLTVSLPRTRLSDPAIPGPGEAQGSELEVIGRTFAPQARVVHDCLLHRLGITPDGETDPNATLAEDDIVSLSVMARLESLATLERIYASAATVTADDVTLRHKASEYRRRFTESLRRAVILIDTNGDGHADVRWRLGDLRLTRV